MKRDQSIGGSRATGTPDDALPPGTPRHSWRASLSLAWGKHDYVEELAFKSDYVLANINKRRNWLIIAFLAGAVVTFAIWVAVLAFPSVGDAILKNGFNSDLPSRYSQLLTAVIFLIPFAPPFVSAFALINLMFPSVSESEVTSGVMSGFVYAQQTNRQSVRIIAAGAVGGLNCLLTLIAIMNGAGNKP